MKIQARRLTDAPLVRDWLANQSPASGFFPGNPFHPSPYEDLAREVDGRFTKGKREELRALLEGGGPHAQHRLDRFVQEEGFVVTTGQQPVLFGGPLFVLYKALTAVALAHRLENLLERPVLPVFWIASEDHDWEEARQISLLDVENTLRRPALAPRSGPAPALYRIPLAHADGAPGDGATGGEGEDTEVHQGGDLDDALRLLLDSLPDSDFAPRWTELIAEAWSPEATLPSAFALALTRLLADDGLFLIQSHSSALRKLSHPVLSRELAHREEAQSQLADRAQALEAAGYSPQVPILDGATNLFLDSPESRERILAGAEGQFHLRNSGRALAEVEIERALDADTSTALSPNVLLRPVVEASILPTLAYVAGPGEASYLAQTEPLFRLHKVHRPLVHPRFAGEVIEGKIQKVLGKFDLEVEDLATPHHELAGRLARQDVPPSIRKEVGSFRGALARHTAQLREAVAQLDPTLGPTVEQLKSQGFAQLDEVERKVTQALKRENEIALTQLSKAQHHLFPEGTPQERGMSFWYYLFRYGPDFLDQLREEIAMGPGRIRGREAQVGRAGGTAGTDR